MSKTSTYGGQGETGQRTVGQQGDTAMGSTGRQQVGPSSKQIALLPCILLHLFLTRQIRSPDIPLAGREGVAHDGTAGRGGNGQDGRPTYRPVHKSTVRFILQTIEDNPPGPISGSRNKGNPVLTERATKQPVGLRFIRSLSACPRPLSVSGCWPMYRCRKVYVNPSLCRANPGSILPQAPIWTARRCGRRVLLSGQPTQMSFNFM